MGPGHHRHGHHRGRERRRKRPIEQHPSTPVRHQLGAAVTGALPRGEDEGVQVAAVLLSGRALHVGPARGLLAQTQGLHRLTDHRHGDLPGRLACKRQADRGFKPRDGGVGQSKRPQSLKPLRQTSSASEHADVAGGRREGRRQRLFIQICIMGGDRHGGPEVQADLRQGLRRRGAQIANAVDRRWRLRPLGTDEGGLEPHLGPHRRHSQGGGVGADHHQARRRIEPAEDGSTLVVRSTHPAVRRLPERSLQVRRQVRRTLARRETGPFSAVG